MRLTDKVRRRSLALIAVSVLGVAACRGNPAPVVTPAYTGRLHVTFVSKANWNMAPASRKTVAIQSRSDAERRAHASATELRAASIRVYFGVFTGRDALGGMHDQTPAWLVVGAGIPKGSAYRYGVVAFS